MRDADGMFTTAQVLRLTGVTRRRLNYWVEREIIIPEINRPGRHHHLRLFSFRNLVELRVTLWLRDKISLQLIRKLVGRLRNTDYEESLATVTFGVVEGGSGDKSTDVVMQGPDGAWETLEYGQRIMEVMVPIRRFSEEMARAAAEDRLRQRRPGQIERRRGVLGSAPVLAGTRIPTRAIYSLYSAGYNTARILESYPGLHERDVRVAIRNERRRRSKSA